MKPILLLELSTNDLTRGENGRYRGDVDLVYLGSALRSDPHALALLEPAPGEAGPEGETFLFESEVRSLLTAGTISRGATERVARELARMAQRAHGAAYVLGLIAEGGQEHRRMLGLSGMLGALGRIWEGACDPSFSEEARAAFLQGRAVPGS